uniref:Uncharacterized protein n=1 Tax=viral metagenome TaxID=1070528 RepID=A0A6C0CLC3_9ZZZZ
MATKTVFIPCCCGRPLMANMVFTDCDWLGEHIKHIPTQCGKICCCGKCEQAQPVAHTARFEPRRFSVVRSNIAPRTSPQRRSPPRRMRSPRSPPRRPYVPVKRQRSQSPVRPKPYVPEPIVKEAEPKEESEEEQDDPSLA